LCPGGRRGDPRLGQPAHSQQVSQVRGVSFVVLHASVGETLDSQRVCQVHLGTQLLQHVDCPVPAVGGFQHHLGVLTGLGDLLGQRDRVVVDAYRLQPLAGISRHPHQHAASAVQVDPYDLRPVVSCVHRGLLRRSGRDTTSVARGSRRSEAPLLHRITGWRPRGMWLRCDWLGWPRAVGVSIASGVGCDLLVRK
jgi:hypothetical protein